MTNQSTDSESKPLEEAFSFHNLGDAFLELISKAVQSTLTSNNEWILCVGYRNILWLCENVGTMIFLNNTARPALEVLAEFRYKIRALATSKYGVVFPTDESKQSIWSEVVAWENKMRLSWSERIYPITICAKCPINSGGDCLTRFPYYPCGVSEIISTETPWHCVMPLSYRNNKFDQLEEDGVLTPEARARFNQIEVRMCAEQDHKDNP